MGTKEIEGKSEPKLMHGHSWQNHLGRGAAAPDEC
jgi:hypothetical protein